MSDHNVLVVAPRSPLPLKSGAQLRIFHTVKELSKKFDVSLVYLIQNGEGKNEVNKLKEMGINPYQVHHTCSKRSGLLRFGLSTNTYRVSKFKNPQFGKKVRSVIKTNSFDFIWVHFLTTLALIPQSLPSPLILDQHNADVEYWETFREGSILERIFAVVNQRRLRKLQNKKGPKIDAILSVSEEDADATRGQIEDTPVWVTPNGVDLSKFQANTSDSNSSNTVSFIGSLDRPRNEEAVKWFAEESWPTVYNKNPEAEFHIVGRNPTSEVSSLGSTPGVNVIGEVPEVVPIYNQSDVIVAPFLLGGGTKLKVLEALAMERALVSTPKGCTGIDVTDGKDAVIRERDEDFSGAIINLLNDSRRRKEIGKSGRRFVEKNYSWDAIMDDTISKIKGELL